MKAIKILPVFVLVLAVTLTIVPYVFAQSGPSVVVMQPNTYYDPANCVGVQLVHGLYFCSAPPTPTTVPATPTAIPPTATVIAPTPTPTGGPASINGTPLCGARQPSGQVFGPAHDPTKWHPLVQTNPDGSVLCTYGHEHGMNPAQFDAQLGPLNVPGGQQISYPWATVTSSGVPENGPDYKHRSYKWMGYVRACVSKEPQLTALRWEAHNDGSIGATARFHSYWFEAQVTDCGTGEMGYVSMGGHMDYAHLTVGSSKTVVALSVDPPGACVLNGDGRQEGLLGDIEQSDSVWYGTSNRAESSPGCDDYYGESQHVAVAVNLGTDSWGPIDPNNPGAFQFYPNREAHHGTLTGSDVFNVTVSAEFPTDAAGKINFSGFVDRHGRVVPSACSPSSDCIPLTIRNARPYPVLYKMDPAGVGYNGDVPGPNGQAGYYVETPSVNR